MQKLFRIEDFKLKIDNRKVEFASLGKDLASYYNALAIEKSAINLPFDEKMESYEHFLLEFDNDPSYINLHRYFSDGICTKEGVYSTQGKEGLVWGIESEELNIINELLPELNKVIGIPGHTEFENMNKKVKKIAKKLCSKYSDTPIYHIILGVCNYFLGDYSLSNYSFKIAEYLLGDSNFSKMKELVNRFLKDLEALIEIQIRLDSGIVPGELKERRVAFVGGFGKLGTDGYNWQEETYSSILKSDIRKSFQEIQKTKVTFIPTEIFRDLDAVVETIPLDSEYVVLMMNYDQVKQEATIALKDNLESKIAINVFRDSLKKFQSRFKSKLIIFGCESEDFGTEEIFSSQIFSVRRWSFHNIIPFGYGLLRTELILPNNLQNNFFTAKLFTALFSPNVEGLTAQFWKDGEKVLELT